MKSVLLLCLCLLVLLLGEARAQTAPDTLSFTVEKAVLRALEISPEVGQRTAARDFATARWRYAKASRYLTNFTATTAHAFAPGLKNVGDTPEDAYYLNPDIRNDWSNLQSFNLIQGDLLQPIYTWGEISGSIRAAQHAMDLEAASIESKTTEVALRTAELYYNLQLTDALIRLTAEADRTYQQAQAEINRLLEEGNEDVDEADRFQLELFGQELERNKVEVQQKRLTAQMGLARQLFLPEGTIVRTDTVLLAPTVFVLDSLDTYFDAALVHRPEMAQARSGLAARDALVKVARSNYYPKIFAAAGGRYSYTPARPRQRNPYIGDPFLTRSFQVGIGIQQKLNFFQTRAQVEQARAQRNEVVFQQRAAEQLILFEVEEAYRNVLIARNALNSQNESLRISREWLRTEQINFDLEIGDVNNLVGAAKANLELQASRYSSIQNYNVAILRLLRATGTLVPNIKNGTLVGPTP